MLKPQDILVALRLATNNGQSWTYPQLAASLHMSASEVHGAVKRAARSGLVDEPNKVARNSALLEFSIHGLRYMFPPIWTGVTRGVPTSYAAPPLAASIVNNELPPVWPHPDGQLRGQGLAPIYKAVADAALEDPALYELLALVDAVRSGRAREREMAIRLLRERLQ